jgi:peptide-methionine (S)-S-oxide reductase
MATPSTATFGGGCFWCTEAVFKGVRGVHAVRSGYSGGHDASPTYESVCSGRTGHAEVIQVLYDPSQVSYEDLLEIFFHTHDPTTRNRQGNDVGPQYRSVIFAHDQSQSNIAQQYIRQLNESRAYERPIVTEVVPFENFYAAEEYHHDYFERHPDQPYCQFVIRPKMQKFREAFENKLAGE